MAIFSGREPSQILMSNFLNFLDKIICMETKREWTMKLYYYCSLTSAHDFFEKRKLVISEMLASISIDFPQFSDRSCTTTSPILDSFDEGVVDAFKEATGSLHSSFSSQVRRVPEQFS